MNPLHLLLGLSLLASATCLWVRKATWPSHWDGSATNSIVLLTINVLMMTPAIGMPLSPHIHKYTGVWNIEELFGHICYIGALMGFLAMATLRTTLPHPALQKFLRRNIELLGAFFVPMAVALFVYGGGGDENLGDLVMHGPTIRMYPYWILVGVTSLYLSTVLTVVFWDLRRSRVCRFTCTLYLIGCHLSLLNFVFGIAIIFTPSASIPMWVSIRVELIVFAIAATVSWTRRVKSMHKPGKKIQPA